MTIPSEILEVAGTPVSEWPEELRKNVEENPELLQVLEQQERIASLMALKRYEKPNPAAQEQIRSRIQERIRKGEARTSPLLDIDALPDWVRMAAAVVVMLGLSVWTHREMMNGGTGSVENLAGQAIPGNASGGFSSPASLGNGAGFGDMPLVESSFQLPSSGDEYLSGGIVFRNQDPFTTLVSQPDPEVPLLFQFGPDLTRQIEASFVERSLMETNRVNASPLLPARLDVVP